MLCCTQEKHYRFYVQKQKNCDNVTPNAVHIFSSVISDGRFSCAMILPSDDWEIPDSCDNLYLLIKWCQPRTTGNKNTFGSFASNKMSIVFNHFFKKGKKIERIDYFHTLYLTFHIKFLNSTNLNLAIAYFLIVLRTFKACSPSSLLVLHTLIDNNSPAE